MEHLVSAVLSGTSGLAAYALVLLVLLLCGLGLPIPEDITLVTGGFLAFSGAARLDVMIVIAFVGILGGDSMIFGFGRRFGDRVSQHWPFRRIITPEKRVKVERLFAKYGHKIVMAARFMPGARAVIFFVAGTASMRYVRFILFDGLAALVSAPVFVFLGHHFGGDIRRAIEIVRHSQWVLLLVLLAMSAYFFIRWLIGRRQRTRAAEATLAAPVSEARQPAVVLGGAPAPHPLSLAEQPGERPGERPAQGTSPVLISGEPTEH